MKSHKLKKAERIAKSVHSDQEDKIDKPYMAHIYNVSERVKHLGEDYEIVALLHDAIEDAIDHPRGRQFQIEIQNQIKQSFNEEVVEAINVMTKLSSDDYFTDYLPRVKKNKIAKQVKIADSSHNLSKAHLLDDEPELQQKLKNKYIKVLNELGVDGALAEKPLIFLDDRWIER